MSVLPNSCVICSLDFHSQTMATESCLSKLNSRTNTCTVYSCLSQSYRKHKWLTRQKWWFWLFNVGSTGACVSLKSIKWRFNDLLNMGYTGFMVREIKWVFVLLKKNNKKLDFIYVRSNPESWIVASWSITVCHILKKKKTFRRLNSVHHMTIFSKSGQNRILTIKHVTNLF